MGVTVKSKLGLARSQGGTPESLKRGPSFCSDRILSLLLTFPVYS